MPNEPCLFNVNPTEKTTLNMVEVDYSQLGIQERRDIQEWIAANPSILGQELLVVGKEFSEFNQLRERPDLIAVAPDGQLAVIELKRDDTGDNAHWQAIKYASYFHSATTDDIVTMFARYRACTPEDARQRLIEYTDSNDELDRLNENQRIILASHRFAPQVTSAALWLNEQAKRDLVTCVQLTPYQDPETGTLYLLANTIIPVPGAETYFVGISSRAHAGSGTVREPNPNKVDDVTRFCEYLVDQVLTSLPVQLRPNRRSRWAGGYEHWRYYHMWYSGPDRQNLPPWGNWDTYYNIELEREPDAENRKTWRVSVGLGHPQIADDLRSRIQELNITDGLDLEVNDDHMWVSSSGELSDDAFRDELAQTLRCFVETVTPTVMEFMDPSGEDDS
ncbi:MAG: hypothetical protein OXN22_00295 [Deltaproteobacteria bacterium]|nr:hypothetical protein [Deltaproteobacteria bacterium]